MGVGFVYILSTKQKQKVEKILLKKTRKT